MANQTGITGYMGQSLRGFIGFRMGILLLLVVGIVGEGYGQNREYAEVTPSSGRNGATIVLGAIESYSPTNNSIAQVRNVSNAGDADESTHATMEASNTSLLLVQWAGESWAQMKFPTDRPANTTTFVRVDVPTSTGLSVNLLETVGGLLGLFDNDVIIPEVYAGATAGNNGTQISGANVSSTLVLDDDDNLYIAITSTQIYNAVRIKLRNQLSLLGLSLGSTLYLNVYEAFSLTGEPTCGNAIFTDLGKTTGVNVSLGDVIQNPYNAIDGNINTHSTISTGTLHLLGSVFQTFYFSGLSAKEDYFKVKLKIGGGSLLVLDLLGNFEVRAYKGNELVFTKNLQSALVNNLDLLGLLKSDLPVILFFEPDVPFDRIAVGINTIAAISLESNPLEIYSVERYGTDNSLLTCVDPSIPEITSQPTDVSICEGVPAEFSVIALSESEILLYQWQYLDGANWIDIPDATTAVYEITTTSLEHDGRKYRIKIRRADYLKLIYSDVVTLAVHPKPGKTHIDAT